MPVKLLCAEIQDEKTGRKGHGEGGCRRADKPHQLIKENVQPDI